MKKTKRAIALFAWIAIVITSFTGCTTHNKQDPYKDMSAKTIYEKGKQQALDGKYKDAITDFEAVETRFPYGEFTNKSQLALIHAYYKNHETASALAAADRFIRTHPTHANIDFAYYMKGVINYDANFSIIYHLFPLNRSKRDPSLARQSFDDFKVLLEKFPKSPYAADARQRMIHLRNQLAEHELHIANYYMTKEAYLAAANRAGYIVNQFSTTKSVEPALMIMIKAYHALGMQELANDAEKLLTNNFPKKANS